MKVKKNVIHSEEKKKRQHSNSHLFCKDLRVVGCFCFVLFFKKRLSKLRKMRD